MTRSPRKNSRALVMLSGGLDSAVALYWVLRRGYDVETITFDYHNRSRKERDAALSFSAIGKNCYTIDVRFLKEIASLKNKIRNKKLLKAPEGYIPSRNIIFYGIASTFAEVIGARYIVGGHNRDDVRSFRDASELFFAQFNKTTSLGLFTGGRTGRVIQPLAKLSKSQVVLLGSKLGVPFEKTWSCYRSGLEPCEVCPSCRLRSKAFEEAGIFDPLTAGRDPVSDNHKTGLP
ncbi:MAG TPA: 7-cyano-7-deazaguanine synthase [Nitrososphaerales archaeon]|nr:7-cyano-7-deazaguanine synthase [Nitrososphaerales archaeon]